MTGDTAAFATFCGYPCSMRRIIAAAVVLAAGATLAGPGTPVRVEVGQTVEVDVAHGRGLICDDTTIVDASLVTRGDHNFLRLTGRKLGQTLCRVGTNPQLPPWYLFEVDVVAPRSGR